MALEGHNATVIKHPRCACPKFPSNPKRLEMSKKLFYDPRHWQDLAEGARKIGNEIIEPISRRKMLEIAEIYESLNKRAEKKLQELKKTGRHRERA
jgi:hypothetical protein